MGRTGRPRWSLHGLSSRFRKKVFGAEPKAPLDSHRKYEAPAIQTNHTMAIDWHSAVGACAALKWFA